MTFVVSDIKVSKEANRHKNNNNNFYCKSNLCAVFPLNSFEIFPFLDVPHIFVVTFTVSEL